MNSNESLEMEQIAQAEAMLSSLGVTLRDLRGKKVLELGSGRGCLVDYLTDNGADTVGLDYDMGELVASDSLELVISHMGPPMLARGWTQVI